MDNMMKKVKWYLIEMIPDITSEIIETYDTKEEARSRKKELEDPNCLDPYYDGLVAVGGYLRIEDENGNG